MKTHQAWILALTSVVAIAIGQAIAQSPIPMASPNYASFPQGLPVVQQASFNACGGCDGSGCGICGGAPTAGGFHLSNLHRGSSCGCGVSHAPVCDSGACGGGACDSGACGGGACGGLGGPGHLLEGLHGANRYGGYSTMKHGQDNGPFGGGGCCAPIWYDFHVEWMNLRRDDAGSNINFTSRGAGGPVVLSTDDLDFDDANGFRATYAFLVGPSTALEVGYFGLHDWDSAASVTGNGDLFSVFSSFGTDFFNGVQGFPQTVDAADFHGIEYSSELHNAELNLRRRWVSANCLLHGSYMGGLRYVRLSEDFGHDTRVADGGFLNYDVATENDVLGVQLGTDLFVCVSPRFKVGVEVEGGLFGNESRVSTNVNTREVTQGVATDANIIDESASDTDVAFVGEAGAIAMFRVTPRFTLRGGYTVLYMDGLALGSDNFNTSAPFQAVNRVAAVNNSGDTFYHGANAGFTWTW